MKGFILLTVSLISSFCIAQKALNEHPKKFIFGYDYGTSMPENDFAKHDTSKLPMGRLYHQDTTKLNGYAKSGFHYDFYFTYKFWQHLGVTALVSGNENSYDINTINSQYIALYPPNTVIVTTGDNYSVTQYLIGPYISITPVDRLDIEIKALYGITTANYPGLDYIGGSEITLYTARASSTMGYNVGIGIKFMAEEVKEIGLALHLNVNYMGTNINYPSYSITNYTPFDVFINSSTYNTPKTMTMNILQVTFGISVEF